MPLFYPTFFLWIINHRLFCFVVDQIQIQINCKHLLLTFLSFFYRHFLGVSTPIHFFSCEGWVFLFFSFLFLLPSFSFLFSGFFSSDVSFALNPRHERMSVTRTSLSSSLSGFLSALHFHSLCTFNHALPCFFLSFFFHSSKYIKMYTLIPILLNPPAYLPFFTYGHFIRTLFLSSFFSCLSK
jgi:hypothetical protein